MSYTNTGLVLIGLLLGSTAEASAQAQLKIGSLRCDVEGGLGLIIASSKDMTCRFTPAAGAAETYSGTIRKFGLDIGATTGGVLFWQVLAPGQGPASGALEGEYVGLDASASAGAGIGANALIGGFGRTITLQPLSVETQTGFALAAGVSALTLRAAR